MASTEIGEGVERIAKELLDRLTAIANYLEASCVLLGRDDETDLAKVRSVIERAHGQTMSASDLVKTLRAFKS